MAKADTTAAIKAANGSDINPESYTSKQLDELLVLAQQGESGKADYEAKLEAFAPAPAAATAQAPESAGQKKLERPITVHVNDAIAAYGGEFTDPESLSTIGKDPVEVESTAFVAEKLRSRELIEVRE